MRTLAQSEDLQDPLDDRSPRDTLFDPSLKNSPILVAMNLGVPPPYASGMTPEDNAKANGAATAALFIVILLVSVTLAIATDLTSPVRWAISIVSGIVSAAIVYSLTSRSHPKDR